MRVGWARAVIALCGEASMYPYAPYYPYAYYPYPTYAYYPPPVYYRTWFAPVVYYPKGTHEQHQTGERPGRLVARGVCFCHCRPRLHPLSTQARQSSTLAS